MVYSIFRSFNKTKGNCGLTDKQCDGRGSVFGSNISAGETAKVAEKCKTCPLYVKSTKK